MLQNAQERHFGGGLVCNLPMGGVYLVRGENLAMLCELVRRVRAGKWGVPRGAGVWRVLLAAVRTLLRIWAALQSALSAAGAMSARRYRSKSVHAVFFSHATDCMRISKGKILCTSPVVLVRQIAAVLAVRLT